MGIGNLLDTLVAASYYKQLLQVNKGAVNEMIETGKLKAIKIGSQWKIEGKSLKELLTKICQNNFDETIYKDACFYVAASERESAMIAEWT